MWLYWPVRMAARLGVQMELVQKQLSKRMPALRDAVDVGRPVDPAAVGGYGVGGVVVGHDVDDVGTAPALLRTSETRRAGGQQKVSTLHRDFRLISTPLVDM